jgi:hypothetical protein
MNSCLLGNGMIRICDDGEAQAGILTVRPLSFGIGLKFTNMLVYCLRG